MAQHDYTIANQGFPATRADINNALSAIATNNSGTTAPSTQYAGQFWIDTTTTTWTLYIHDGADDIQFATIDTSANTVNFIDSELGDNSVTTAKIADGNVTSAKLSYPLTTFSSTGIDDNATSTAITIDSSENVGIGTTSPTSPNGATKFLQVGSSTDDYSSIVLQDNNNTWEIFQNNQLSFRDGTTTRMILDENGKVGIGTSSPSNMLHISSSDPTIRLQDTDATGYCLISSASNSRLQIKADDGNNDANTSLEFHVDGSEAMRITSDSRVLIGKTSNNLATVGIELTKSNGALIATRSGGQPLFINRLSNDGTLVSFYQNTTEEGTISVSGATVSYNGFTGTHWSRFTDNSTPNILRGTVLESLDEMCDWYNLEFDVTTTTQDDDGNDVTETHTEKVPHVLADGQSVGDIVTYNHEGTDVQATIVKETDVKHVKSKVSDTVDAKNVYGVFMDYDNDGEGYNDFYVASVGSFVVRIKQGETIAKGDLLQSNGDGTAKVQADDAVRSSSFAKVLSTTVIETYEDGSYLVPCSLMC